jgi:transposase-like protein
MEHKDQQPKTLQQAIKYFSDEQVCIDTVAALRWPSGPTCPACEHREHYYLKSQRRWKCKECYKQFTVKLGTIFEDSPISLDKWLIALWMLVNCKNGISSYEVSRDLGITQKSAWFVLQRLRLALQSGSLAKMGGPGSEVEVDETFIGGKARNMHKERRSRLKHYGRAADKAIVMGLLERGGKVHAKVVPDAKKDALWGQIRGRVETGSTVYTDQAPVYYELGKEKEYDHQVINHLEKYVDGRVSTNGIENFWSLLKRGLNGTYIAVEPFHLFRYVDEQVFRFNHRKDKDGSKLKDADRFKQALSQVAGKRLTFKEVTGKVGETAF